MGWSTDLHDASFRGVHFECISTTDAVSKALAIQQAPYSNDASIDDMGNNPRDISIAAVYTGEDYKTWVDALEAALLETGSGELIHPVFGIMQVQVADYTIEHSAEHTDYCTISMKFIQAKDKKRHLFIPIQASKEILTLDIIQTPATALEQHLKQLKRLDQNRFYDEVMNIRNRINEFREGLDLVKTTIDDVLSPADFIVGLVDDVGQLVTFDLSISALSKWRDLGHRISRFAQLFDHGDHHSTAIQQLWQATQVAAQVAITQVVLKDVRANLANGQTTQNSLTPIDLAVIRQHNRKLVQSAILFERHQSANPSSKSRVIQTAVAQIHTYKTVADQLHLNIQALIEIHPPVIKTQIIVPCSVHWLAHQLYADMSRAKEILRLNPDLQNPAVLQVGMELTVYAR